MIDNDNVVGEDDDDSDDYEEDDDETTTTTTRTGTAGLSPLWLRCPAYTVIIPK